jgi:hypothetical protein
MQLIKISTIANLQKLSEKESRAFALRNSRLFQTITDKDGSTKIPDNRVQEFLKKFNENKNNVIEPKPIEVKPTKLQITPGNIARVVKQLKTNRTISEEEINLFIPTYCDTKGELTAEAHYFLGNEDSFDEYYKTYHAT